MILEPQYTRQPSLLVRNLNSIWSLDKGFLPPLQGPKAQSQNSGSVNIWGFVFSTSLPNFIVMKTKNRFEGFYRVSLESEYLGPFYGPKIPNGTPRGLAPYSTSVTTLRHAYCETSIHASALLSTRPTQWRPSQSSHKHTENQLMALSPVAMTLMPVIATFNWILDTNLC